MKYLKRHWYIIPAVLYAALWLWLWQDAGYESFAHAFERTYLHVFSGPAVFLGLFWIQWVLDRKTGTFSLRGLAAYIVPCLAAAFLIFLREVFDVRNGSPLPKSFLDFASWLIGTGWGAYFTYRIAPYAHRTAGEIASARVGRHERSRSRSR